MHVIIVGAGPSGFALTLTLARAGIEVTMIDRDKTVGASPRAAHLMAPGIQVLRRAGVLDEVRRAGFFAKRLAYRRLDGSLIVAIDDIANVKSPDAMTVLPIGDLGNIMLAHAEKNNKVHMKWNSPVVDVGQDEKSAWVIIRRQDGSEERINGDFLCGCDGATSQVRKSVFGARNFPGKTWEMQLVSTNVYYPFEKYGYDDMNTIMDPKECHIVARLSKDGLWRVSYPEDTRMTYEEVLANQAAHYERILPGHPKPGDYKLTNISPYKMHQRCVDKFRIGRILLAADAAHLCNPWGGLGLTGGFADVTGLSECLIGMHTGQADESILDRYNDVRMNIYKTVIDPVSTSNFYRVSADNLDGAPYNDAFLTLCVEAATDPKAREKLNNSVYGMTHDFTQYYNKA